MQLDGNMVKNQTSAIGMGLKLGYQYKFFDLSTSLGILYSSTLSNWVEYPQSRWFKHSLLVFLINVPMGISYPLSDVFRVFFGFKPILGYSSLQWYDSTHYSIIDFWTTSNASLGSTSLGLGFEVGGDFSISKRASFSVRLGYDVINFKKYSGEKEERSSDGTIRIKPAFLIFDLDKSELKIKENYPNPSAKEIWGEENMSGFRVSLGIKIYI